MTKSVSAALGALLFVFERLVARQYDAPWQAAGHER